MTRTNKLLMMIIVSVLFFIFVLNEWSLLVTLHRQSSDANDLLPSAPTFDTSFPSPVTQTIANNNAARIDSATKSPSGAAAVAVATRQRGDDGVGGDVIGSDATTHNNELIHRAFFGLGHRLHRSAAAWHLAASLGGVTQFRFHWERCDDDDGGVAGGEQGPLLESGQGEEYNVFRYLFGDDVWDVPFARTDASGIDSAPPIVPPNRTEDPPLRERKMIVLRNDVYGYVKGQLYKDLQLPVATPTSQAGGQRSEMRTAKDTHAWRGLGPFEEKLISDVQFYKQLRERYRHAQEVDDFMTEHRFSNRLVVGLHIRAGNGEGMHFREAGRHILDESEFVTNLVRLIGKYLESNSGTSLAENGTVKHEELPPLIFLATDTAHLIPAVREASRKLPGGIETVVLPQHRLAANQGVTFSALKGAGQKCLQGWQAMVSDMMLLSRADVLVAARPSTFTQSMPLTLVLEQGRPFCEVSETAEAMTCVRDIETWLFRGDEEKMATYSTIDTGGRQTSQPTAVSHLVTLLLPDVARPVEFGLAQSFLVEPREDPSPDAIFRYGRYKIYGKYRDAKPLGESKWNFV